MSTSNIKLSVPLFIRLLEWSHEDAKEDVELHIITEYLTKSEDTFTMADYDKIMCSLPKK